MTSSQESHLPAHAYCVMCPTSTMPSSHAHAAIPEMEGDSPCAHDRVGLYVNSYLSQPPLISLSSDLSEYKPGISSVEFNSVLFNKLYLFATKTKYGIKR